MKLCQDWLCDLGQVICFLFSVETGVITPTSEDCCENYRCPKNACCKRLVKRAGGSLHTRCHIPPTGVHVTLWLQTAVLKIEKSKTRKLLWSVEQLCYLKAKSKNS